MAADRRPLAEPTEPAIPVPLLVNSTFRTRLGALMVDDCLTILRSLPDESVSLVVTSPPYDRQPRYGTGEA